MARLIGILAGIVSAGLCLLAAAFALPWVSVDVLTPTFSATTPGLVVLLLLAATVPAFCLHWIVLVLSHARVLTAWFALAVFLLLVVMFIERVDTRFSLWAAIAVGALLGSVAKVLVARRFPPRAALTTPPDDQ